ncbi:MAG: UDP-N-acetylglucosamine pyrophosphorylase [Kiritimatiellia bacterium]|jgi:UDP-N-acetylglucosamine/UDP-N-acetylgalactosamine diphosphorylase
MKRKLIDRGVVFPDPDAVSIAPDIDPERFHPGAVIHPGCRISGVETAVGPGARIGAESPATLRNCQIGRDVVVAGGFLDGTTLLDGVMVGNGFHSRPGTLLEECSSVAHAVGLKQTILMPYVTLGSLINFCDVLMAGGTGQDNHSEVGSSYVHFNFTPHQDKATASLVGDVPRGVLLDRKPIFLGGQGGLVGPCRIAYGTIAAAGCILRHDVPEENQLVTGSSTTALRTRPYEAVKYGRVEGILKNCFLYLGNILALRAWYDHARQPIMVKTPWGAACWAGARQRLGEIWKERVKRLDQLAEKFVTSVEAAGEQRKSLVFTPQSRFIEEWPQRRERLAARWSEPHAPEGDAAEAVQTLATAEDCRRGVAALPPEMKAAITTWLQAIVDG